jgi:kynurenine formamidase
MAPEMTDDELLALYERVSNRGRWGEDDELGTLNYITAEKRVQAASRVQVGETVSIGRDLEPGVPDGLSGRVIDHKVLFVRPGPAWADDYIGIAPHGSDITHLDAVCHSTWNGNVYNGRHTDDVQRAEGLIFGSIYAMRHGIFTRGVLLDVARARDVAYLQPDEMVTPEDLEAAESLGGVKAESGDALFVRVGLRAYEADHGPQTPRARAGLGARCTEWMHDREVAVFGGDCVELMPYPSDVIAMPVHHIGMPSMGLVLLDWPDVEPWAVACERLGRWDFAMSVAPIRLEGGTGAAVNPICIF